MDQPSLFSPPKVTREAWLRENLGKRITFEHRTSVFEFVPSPVSDSPIIAGKIGRQRLVKENAPPDMGLADLHRPAWKAIDVFIDPTSHDDGQKIAIDVDQNVGKSLPVLRSFFSTVAAQQLESPYSLDVNAIADPETFWAFVKQNKGEITSVTFELIAPNMFGIRSLLDKEMTELKQKEKVKKARLTLKNEDGLELETDRVRETANYAVEGGGEISASTKRKRKYTSKGKAKSMKVSPRQPDEPEPSFVRRLISTLFRYD
jgi:hypothetical protein